MEVSIPSYRLTEEFFLIAVSATRKIIYYGTSIDGIQW